MMAPSTLKDLQMLRLLSFVLQPAMFWIPLAVELMTFILAIQQRSMGMGILSVVVALVLALYKAVQIGAASGSK